MSGSARRILFALFNIRVLKQKVSWENQHAPFLKIAMFRHQKYRVWPPCCTDLLYGTTTGTHKHKAATPYLPKGWVVEDPWVVNARGESCRVDV